MLCCFAAHPALQGAIVQVSLRRTSTVRRRSHLRPFAGKVVFYNRVVPLDNFMIYKDIIRLDRPD
ncbi:MAG: hypothetical protein [Olavius algarvensis Gamma 1 endosymbiont]|nr:MAG: hypothetical protein [Olavius algarvensis Gamma 1 endosymbiont]